MIIPELTQAFPKGAKRFADLTVWATVLGSMAFIIHLTLTPYHFQFVMVLSHSSPIGLILQFLNGPSDPADIINNIVLFIPLGFSLAWLQQRRQHTRLIVAATPLIVGGALSLMVEFLQLFLPTRTATPIDVLTNSLGALLGLLIFHSSWLVFRSPTYLMIALASWLIAAFAVSVPLQSATRLTNWDPAFSLQIGNEFTGEWPWTGQVFDMAIADTALTEGQIQAFLKGGQSPEVYDNIFVAAYHFADSGSYRDRMATLPDFVWKTRAASAQTGAAATLAPSRWLETQAPAAPLTRQIAETAQFTLIATVATADLAQEGAIIALSGGVWQRNFTLGQEQDHLSFFLRTPITGDDASHIPELFVPDVFADTRPHQVIVTYDRGTFQFYIDGVRQPHAQVITPEYTFFGYLLPPQIASWMQHKLLNPDERYVLLYKLLYEGLVFLPLGWLLALAVQRVPSALALRLRITLLLGGTILPALLLEAERVVAGGQTIQWLNPMWSLIITMCSCVFFHARMVMWERRTRGRSRLRARSQTFSPERTPPIPE